MRQRLRLITLSLCALCAFSFTACDKAKDAVSNVASEGNSSGGGKGNNNGTDKHVTNAKDGGDATRSNEEKTRKKLNLCRNYLMATNPKPEDLSGVKKACAEKGAPLPDKDLWGNALLYTPDPDGGNKFKLYSAGPDGQPDNDDDIHPADDKDNKK
jgi:hypothetical protein